MVVVHGQVHAAAGDAGLVREDGQRGLVLAVVPPVRARRRDARLDARAPAASSTSAWPRILSRVLRPNFIVCSLLMITSENAVDATLHRHERVLGVDAVRVEHVRVAAHRREEHVLQYSRRQ